MYKPKYLTKLEQVPELTQRERQKLQPVSDKFVFRTNEYYQSLIDWDDPNDPIRKIVMPELGELDDWGMLDASGEENYTKVPGLEHKYQFTALLLVNDVCGAYCRFCFRKRLFMDENDEVVRDVSEGIEYIRNHTEINNVLLTGGDPMLMATHKLENIISQLREIDHVKIIRIGSKMPVFNPFRIINDPALPLMLKKYSTPEKRIYVMAHFNHPRELTDVALEGMNMLQNAGVITVNQTPLIRGVNDDPEVLAELFNRLSYAGIPPYYLFICRPTLGNKIYSVPVEESYEIFEQARMKCSGLAKRARLVMSHASGKIEIVGMTEDEIYMRYHRAADVEEKARFMVFKRNPEAYWFDDYDEVKDEFQLINPFLEMMEDK
jgi:lysine 2,3-aminomutase